MEEERKRKQAFWIGFPIPPSANNLYATNWATKQRFKTKAYSDYRREVKQWVMLHQGLIDQTRDSLGSVGTELFINIDTMFHFHRESILTKSGKPKRNDTSNRLKALHDVLSEILGIDDCHFWSGSYSKYVTEGPERVDILFETEGRSM